MAKMRLQRLPTAWLLALGVSALLASPTQAEIDPAKSGADSDARPTRIVPRHFLRSGGRRIESGLRIEGSWDGVRVAEKLFPSGGEPRGMQLPAHLGGGFLFFQPLAVDGSSATAFYRAETWTGELMPLGRIPFAARHVEAGLDRVYAIGVSLQVAFDAKTGELLPLDPLPPLVTILGLAFDGSRRALVQGPLSGVLYTEDSGLTWSQIPSALNIEVDIHGSRLFVRTPDGLSLVDEGGALVPLDSRNTDGLALPTVAFERIITGHVQPEPRDSRTEFSPAASDRFRDERERLWVSTLTRGAPHQGRAFAIEKGKLLELFLDEDLKLRQTQASVPTSSRCLATADESAEGAKHGPLFLCQGKATQVLKLSAAKLLKKGERSSASGDLLEVWRRDVPQHLLSYGNGAAVFSGPCHGRPRGPSSACFVDHESAKPLELPDAFFQSGASRAISVSPDEVWAIWFSRKTKLLHAQRVLATGEPGGAQTRTWKLPKDQSVSEFFNAGAILPRASQTKEGLLLWSTWREKFVGVLLGDSERPTLGAIQRPLQRAVIDGPRAVLWGASGFAKQTVDGGQTYSELSLPYRSGDPELSAVASPKEAVTMGCSQVGCALGRLLKVGWAATPEAEVAVPKARPFTAPGLARYKFTCSSDGTSRPRLSADDPAFPGFWEEPAPRLSAGDVGSSSSFPDDLARLYAWGPQDVSWGRTGRAQAYFVDPWDSGKVYKSAPTLQVYSSHVEAQDNMGLIDRTASSHYATFDPDGRAGVVVSRGRTSMDVIVFEKDKPLERFDGASQQGLRSLKGAVLSHGSFVVAFQQGGTLSIVRLVGGAAVPLVDLPLGDSGERGAQLVRTQSGDLGIAMEGDSALFIYPLSDDGHMGAPILLPHSSHQPPPCPPEATGYIIDRELRVAPYLETSAGGPLPVTRVRAKMIVGYQKSCIDALRGHARELVSVPGAATSGEAIPFSVLNTDSNGRRVQLVCQ